MVRSGVGDELRHQVDAGDADSLRMQVGGSVPGAAADVEHRPGQAGQVPPDQGQLLLVGLPVVSVQGHISFPLRRVRVTNRLEVHRDWLRLSPVLMHDPQLARGAEHR